MKREVKMLLEKACDSLVLSIEVFNRPFDRGRIPTSLILLDHAFEMLLKSAIIHRGGRIRENGARETIGFDSCVRRGLSDGSIKFLSEEQALVLQTINGLRDAAQHYLLEICENQLYLHMQSGVTLFHDLLESVFRLDLVQRLPKRVLPISTSSPAEISVLFESELAEVRKLLTPGRRRGIEAASRIRPLAILDAALKGETTQPSDGDLRRIGRQIASGTPWSDIFPGIAGVEFVADGVGPHLSLRISKKHGIPIHLVPEGTPGASVVGVKPVRELDFYNLGANRLAEKVGLTVPKLLAVVAFAGMQSSLDYYKEIPIGRTTHKLYSQKAIQAVRQVLDTTSIDDIWSWHREKHHAVGDAK